jgi:alcohol dehydrogenase
MAKPVILLYEQIHEDALEILGEVEGFTDGHIERTLTAAKDPQLKMKLQNMPIPLTTEMVDEYMGPILEAAKDGDLSRIKNVV